MARVNLSNKIKKFVNISITLVINIFLLLTLLLFNNCYKNGSFELENNNLNNVSNNFDETTDSNIVNIDNTDTANDTVIDTVIDTVTDITEPDSTIPDSTDNRNRNRDSDNNSGNTPDSNEDEPDSNPPINSDSYPNYTGGFSNSPSNLNTDEHCTDPELELTPISELGTNLYLNKFQGGLYPNGSNSPPANYHAEGVDIANAIVPLDSNGEYDSNGKVVVLSIGMSNATQEFCSKSGVEPCDDFTFTGQARKNNSINHDNVYLANGARGGATANDWSSPQAIYYGNIIGGTLEPNNLSNKQVQVIWAKLANVYHPDSQGDLDSVSPYANNLLKDMGDSVRAFKAKYPNLKMVFLSNRIYAGYASPTSKNPEPMAYEHNFAIKWLIEAQIKQATTGEVDPIAGDLSLNTTPWLGWSADLWANGKTPRQSDGLTWTCSNYAPDLLHPSIKGRYKVGALVLNHFLNSDYIKPWLLK